MTNRIGQLLGNYCLTRQLGRGGFAVVYLGEHVHLKTLAAIKVLHQVQLSSEEEEKFRKEAYTIANLKHPHIIRVLDYGIQESTSTPFLVMDYAKETLRRRYAAGTVLSPAHVLPYVKQVASALQYAHDRKVIHRDVKPENMLLDENDRIRLSDFGIAVVNETSRALNTLDKSGTPPYMAPEQFQGKPSPASDQYSLAIVVYEWLCGTRPFNGALGELLRQHESAAPPPMREKVSTVSPALEDVIQKALAKDPEARYASMWDFAQAFQQACHIDLASNGTQRTVVLSPSIDQSHLPMAVLVERARPVPATPPEDSSVAWNVPYRRNPFFTGRRLALDSLHNAFCSSNATIRTQAVRGLGGIGKTQLAIEYAHCYHADYRVVLWIRGDTREKMLADIASLASILHLKEQYEQEQQHVIEVVRSWLKKNSQWLLIVDNIEDLRLVRTILPATAQGHILLTTRTQTTGNIAQSLDLEKMTPEEGALFLLRRTKIVAQDATLQDASTTDYQNAKAIAEILDGLPLALDQAGAYLEESGCTLVNYLDRYQAGRIKLLGMRGSFAFDHPASVTATFSYAFERVEKINPAAIDLLRFCTFLDPDAIPEELIIQGAAELGPILQPVAADPILLDATIATLRKFSLVHRNSNTNMLSIHRLVQSVLRDSMSEKTQRVWVERVMRAVNLALPDIHEFFMWHRCHLYMPHVLHCMALIEAWHITRSEAVRLLEQAGMYLQIQARYTQANALLERASAMRTVLAEIDAMTTVASLSRLFWHYYFQGQYAHAEQPVWKALHLLQQIPAIEQLAMASCLEAIANLLYQQAKYSQAEDYFLQALAIYEQHVGLQHPSVVSVFNGLGNISLRLAKYTRAERFFWDALNIWQQMPEPQHPFMGVSLSGLAEFFIARGHYAQAEIYLQQEHAHLELTLHPLHPALAHNLNNRALLCMAQGKYSQIEPLLKQALTILEQSVGLLHPIAGRTFDALGRLAYLQRKYGEAEQFFQKAQNIFECSLGVEHPDVLTTVNNLADVYRKQSKSGVAEELYKDVLTARIQLFGTDHPAIAQTLQSMAQLSYTHGQYNRTEHIYKEALSICERVLGTGHPEVARNLYGLALIYHWKWKKFSQAETLLRRALAIYVNADLPEHPEVAQILKTYASLLLVLNRRDEAADATLRAKTILAKGALTKSDESSINTGHSSR